MVLSPAPIKIMNNGTLSKHLQVQGINTTMQPKTTTADDQNRFVNIKQVLYNAGVAGQMPDTRQLNLTSGKIDGAILH